MFYQQDTIQNQKVIPNTGFFFPCFFQIRRKPKIDDLLVFFAKPSFYNYALDVSMALA